MGFKAVPYSTTVCGSNCEGCGSICLSSPNDATYSTTFTSVDFASYGTPNGSCGSYSYGGCHAGSSYGVVYNTFIGQTSGCVNPVNGTFGDPCRGTYKRLYIQLTASGTQQVFVPIPTINTFVANPNPQNSSSTGIPYYNTTLTWTTTNGSGGSATITSSIGETFNVSSIGGSLAITNLPQSVAGSNSPATRTYTLTVCNELNECVFTQITVSARNDNYPTSFSIPSTTTTSVPLNSLEPNTQYNIYVGPITGIDMTTAVTCNTAGLDASTDQVTWSSTVYITSGTGVYFRFTSQPFNTDPSGLTNSRTFNFTVGSFPTQSFTATTRAPDVNETFDYGNTVDAYPYPDIDVISNTPTQYLVSPTTLTVDDIEIPVEIKVDKPDAEVRIKQLGSSTYGNWQSVRQKT
jgi:hypothetical protein